jgi:hypothetical protein
MSLLDRSAALLRPDRQVVGEHAPQAPLNGGSRSAAWQAGRFVVLVLCKLALILAVAQTPSGVSSADMAEVARKATEECLLSEARFEAVGRQARERCCPFTRPQATSFSVDHRSDSRAHSLGHRLSNGLLAPLRC